MSQVIGEFMENKTKFDFKLKRRKLFLFAGTGIGLFIMNKIIPGHLAGKNIKSLKPEIVVKLNPEAVNRNKSGRNNV